MASRSLLLCLCIYDGVLGAFHRTDGVITGWVECSGAGNRGKHSVGGLELFIQMPRDRAVSCHLGLPEAMHMFICTIT